MGFKCGIVGLPNVGKSTLFNALTNSSKAQAENFPFCTIDPNIGVVPVPDDRLDQLVKISNSKNFSLGLLYVKHVVEAHGGTVKIESEIGEKTEVTLKIPIILL